MDERKIDAPPQRTPVAPGPVSSETRLNLHGSEIRIDSHHVSQIGTPPAPVPAARANSQLLAEAGRILEQLQVQDAELAERQALLEDRLAAFEAERRADQIRRAEADAELETRRRELNAAEVELVARTRETQELLAQVDASRLALQQERHDVELRRESLRGELIAELRHDRDALEADRVVVATELERARTLSESLERKLQEATTEAERLIQAERERLWQTLMQEWEQRRTQFQQDHDLWLAQVQAERVEIEREKAFYEAAVRSAESDFSTARQTQELELQTLRDEQIATLQRERAEMLERIQAEREEWERTLQEQQREWAAIRQHQSAELQAERDSHSQRLQTDLAALNSAQAEWTIHRDAQLVEIQGERAILENRIRFQQEHLEKLRSDLERSQNEHRRERQVERQRLEDDSRQIIRRMQQIDFYRAAVDERERSLERERDVLDKSRRAFSSSVEQDRLSLQREMNAWQAERQVQQSELLRQQELYASHAESLESRRIRLEKLRAELEDTHRATLEMRLAIEETWVELTQAAGQETARERVEQVRNSLIGYYNQLHEGLVEQRREHLEAQTKFERLRAEFHAERQKLMEWITSRDQELRIGEDRLRTALADAASRDATWQVARERWMHEKAEAEQVIRKLLSELGNQHRNPMPEIPTTLPPSLPGEFNAEIPLIT